MKRRRGALLDGRALTNLLTVLIAISFYLVVSNLSAVRGHLQNLVGVLKPFVIGFAIAFLLNAPMRLFEQKVFYKLKCRQGLSILAVYLLAVALLTMLMQTVLPQLTQSVQMFVSNINGYLRNLNQLTQVVISKLHLEEDAFQGFVVTYNDVVRQATDLLYAKLPDILNWGMALSSGVVSGVTAVIASVYMLASKQKLTQQIKRMLYAFFPTQPVNIFLSYCRRANSIFAAFINGKLIDSAIIGALCFVFSQLLHVPFAILVSVIVGVTNIIPFFGPIIGAIPCLMILSIVDPWSALRFAVLIILLQQFDGNILGPKILGDSTGLSPILVLIAIVAGGGLFGFVGMVLGVPTFALLYSILRDITAVNLVKRGVDENGAPLPDYMTCQPSDCEAKTPPTESEKKPHSAAPPNERKI